MKLIIFSRRSLQSWKHLLFVHFILPICYIKPHQHLKIIKTFVENKTVTWFICLFIYWSDLKKKNSSHSTTKPNLFVVQMLSKQTERDRVETSAFAPCGRVDGNPSFPSDKTVNSEDRQDLRKHNELLVY